MAWSTPKTDWVADDYIDYTAYNRWINNLSYLQTLCQEMYTLTATDLGSDKTVSDIPYASMLNNIETALENLNLASYNFDIGTTVSFSANSQYIAYTEINRIESAMLKLYTWLTAQFENIPTLSFTLGNYRGIKI